MAQASTRATADVDCSVSSEATTHSIHAEVQLAIRLIQECQQHSGRSSRRCDIGQACLLYDRQEGAVVAALRRHSEKVALHPARTTAGQIVVDKHQSPAAKVPEAADVDPCTGLACNDDVLREVEGRRLTL